MTVAPVMDEVGTPTELIVLLRDITERIHLERSLDAIDDTLRDRLQMSQATAAAAAARGDDLARKLTGAETREEEAAEREYRLQGHLDLAQPGRDASAAVARQAQKGKRSARWSPGWRMTSTTCSRLLSRPSKPWACRKARGPRRSSGS